MKSARRTLLLLATAIAVAACDGSPAASDNADSALLLSAACKKNGAPATSVAAPRAPTPPVAAKRTSR